MITKIQYIETMGNRSKSCLCRNPYFPMDSINYTMKSHGCKSYYTKRETGRGSSWHIIVNQPLGLQFCLYKMDLPPGKIMVVSHTVPRGQYNFNTLSLYAIQSTSENKTIIIYIFCYFCLVNFEFVEE